ncbi:MAG: hypothetical protein AB8B82_08265 [Roseovarius sp.]
MHRTFIALVLSAAVAVTGFSAAPARADDTEKWIAGAAALAIIGLAINQESKKKRKRKAQQQYYYNNHGYTAPTVYHNPRLLPAKCKVVRNLQGHKVRGLARGCLKRHNVNVQALPQHCKIKIRDPQTNKKRVIFGGRCLRNQGYSLARLH